MQCPNCEIVYINGVRCHETGCPTAYEGTIRECKECGAPFQPESKGQDCCSVSCRCAYYNLEEEESND